MLLRAAFLRPQDSRSSGARSELLHMQFLMGTPTLRKCIDGTSARRVFSFIFRDRTLDLEFSTEEECRRNLRLFKVLVAEASK